MHLGGGTSDGRLEKALRSIEEARPDLIVNTGDFLDSPADNLKEYSAMLARLSAPLGKYSIPGNHEYYVGIEEAERFNQAAGFTFLRGQSVRVTDDLWIAGADDPAREYGAPAPPDPLPVPRRRGGGRSSCCSSTGRRSRPVRWGGSTFSSPATRTAGRYSPSRWSSRRSSGTTADCSIWGKARQLYVSRGTGTWARRCGSSPRRRSR